VLGRIPYLVDTQNFTIRFEALGEVYLEDNPIESGKSIINISEPIELEVRNGIQRKKYTVLIKQFTGLPIVYIETENRREIDSKEEYVNANIRLIDNQPMKGSDRILEAEVQIKGRGNSTWNRLPKKPYRLKFNEKVSLLGMPKDKSWVLLANHADKTMLRNHITFFMGSISKLDYTPRSQFVELFLNGKYNGTYQLTEKLKISEDRVNVGKDGFLAEVDDYAPKEDDARYFRTKHLLQPVNIKDPDVEYDDEDFSYFRDYVTNAENILFSEDFKNKETGWQKYMDINSFVDYYLIQEITKNTDGFLYSSCFMNLRRGEKLKLGPLWDYDLAYGNYSGNVSLLNPEGFWIKRAEWFGRLFEDPEFVNEIKSRFHFFYDNRDDIIEELNRSYKSLSLSAEENNNRWQVLYQETWPNNSVFGSYASEVQWLKEWILNRMEWLKTEFESM